MTFDEWWKQTKPAECDELKPYFEEAWEISAATEREACAKLADAHFIYGHSVAGPHFAAALADAIRMRSNV